MQMFDGYRAQSAMVATVAAISMVAAPVSEAKDLDEVAAQYRAWIVGSEQVDLQQPQIQQRYQALLEQSQKAHADFDGFKWKPDEPFDFTKGGDGKEKQKEARDLFKQLMLPLSLAYHVVGDGQNPDYQNPKTWEKIKFIFSYLEKKGWKKGLEMGYSLKGYRDCGVLGFGGSMGNNFVCYSLSVFLNKEQLAEEGILQREIETLEWASNVVGAQEGIDNPKLWEVTGFNADAIRAMFNNRLALVLTMDKDDPQREVEAKHFARLFDKSLQIADGWADFIKPDFTGWHHKNAYLNAYAPGGFHTAALMAWLLEGSDYALSKTAKNNLAQALLAERIYSHTYDVPRGGSGRFPDNLGTLAKQLPAFAYTAQLDTDFKGELEGALARLWNPKNPHFNDWVSNAGGSIMYHDSLGSLEFTLKEVAGKKAEANPQGHWYFPYAGVTIYRQDDWMLSHKGASSFIWDFESGLKQNELGRFLSAGAIQIYAGKDANGVVSSDASGYGTAGMNWSRLSGATTLDLPMEQVRKQHKRYHRHLTTSSFLGGVNFEQKGSTLGLTGLEYKDPYSDLEFRQSVLAFDDFALVSATGIASKGTEVETQTTLFQARKTQGDVPFKVITTESALDSPTSFQAQAADSQNLGLVDPQNHAYLLLTGEDVVLESGEQESLHNSGTKKTQGAFTTARILHGKNPSDANFSYLMQVHGGEAGVKAMQQNLPVETLQMDKQAHVIKINSKNAVAYTAFEPTSFETATTVKSVDTPSLLLERSEHPGLIQLAVTNPHLGKSDEVKKYGDISGMLWHSPSTVQAVEVTLDGQWVPDSGATDQVEIVSSENGQTTLRFACFDATPIVVSLKSAEFAEIGCATSPCMPRCFYYLVGIAAVLIVFLLGFLKKIKK